MSGPVLESDDDLLPSRKVKVSLGGISDMTLWRWTHQLGFPPPDEIIQRRKYWRRSTLKRWLASRPRTAPPPPKPGEQRAAA